MVHTFCIWGMQNCRKHTGGPKKNHGKWSSTSQKRSSKHTWSFQYKTGAYFLHMGGHTKHAPLATNAGDSGTNFGWFWCLYSLWCHTEMGKGFLECHHKQQDTLREWTPLGLHKCIVLCMPFFRNPLDWHIVASNGQINACMIFECIFRVAIYSVNNSVVNNRGDR